MQAISRHPRRAPDGAPVHYERHRPGAQRIKLVVDLSKVRDDVTRRGKKQPLTPYALDEPTVGLHMADGERLIRVLHRVVGGGHSVVVIEL